MSSGAEPENQRCEVYLDWNATTPPHPSVVEAMQRASAELWGNPSSVHAAGRRARAVLETRPGAFGKHRRLRRAGRRVHFRRERGE